MSAKKRRMRLRPAAERRLATFVDSHAFMGLVLSCVVMIPGRYWYAIAAIVVVRQATLLRLMTLVTTIPVQPIIHIVIR